MGKKDEFLPFPKSFETICIHHSQDPNQWKSKAVVPHIVPSTIFKIDDPTIPRKYTYGRMGNPTRSILENVLAAINKGKYALCFSSGMSALMGILGLLKCQDHIISCSEVCGEVHQVFKNLTRHYGICTTFVNFNDTSSVCDAIQSNTKLIWVENPTNATLRIIDICNISETAKANKIWLGVDNSFLTPYLQRPLELGADIVMQSLTKYMNGHSDIIMGSLCTESLELYKQLSLTQVVQGFIPPPFDCYQVLRGLKTLNLRMDQHHKNAMLIAKYLHRHPAVTKVIHPGLQSHPHHKILKQQASGHSGIVSFYIKGGLNESMQFLKCLKVFTVTEVAGGAESTVQIPYVMSHKHLSEIKKRKLNICDNLIKISVGLENICDLIMDIEGALDYIRGHEICKDE